MEPHSLVQAGRRWHMRGYCLETGDFRDFVLGRIAKLNMLDQAAESTLAEDLSGIPWSRYASKHIPSLRPASRT
ncbi:MAG: WYL domain-containing protein [Burkholderiaceae bacterium]|nr:WYL domain-containing protein [Burkholderiaceae bacterium]